MKINSLRDLCDVAAVKWMQPWAILRAYSLEQRHSWLATPQIARHVRVLGYKTGTAQA